MLSFSFIIPAYNAEDTLEKCVVSITEQPYDNLEVIIVDDGSSDKTLEIASALAKDDERITVIHQKNCGVSKARNAGLSQATGNYVFFCDSDDWIEDGSLPFIASSLERNSPDTLITDYYRERGNKSIRVKIFPDDFFTTDKKTITTLQALILYIQPSRITTPSFSQTEGLGGAAWHYFFKRERIKQNNIVFDSYLDGLLEDGYFAMNILELASTVEYVSVPFYHYRTDAESSTHGYHPEFLDRCYRAIDRFQCFGNQTNKPEEYTKALQARIGYFVKKLCAVDYLCPGNPLPESARYSSFVSAVSSDPFKTALQQTDITQFSSKLERFQAKLLAKRHLKAYWILRKIKLRIDPIQ